MLKIFLTGDNHIGLKYTGHPQSALLSKTRLQSFTTLIHTANQEACTLSVISGDLFENTYSIPKKDVAALLDILSAFHGTVAVLPGNHDYYDKDAKLWQYFEEASAAKDNILLMNQYRPYPLTIDGEPVILYPALCTSLHSAPGENNLAWLKAQPITGPAYHIGVAHGAVEGETIDREGRYFLMTRDELESIPVDLWLIGHTHVPFPRDVSEDTFTSAGKIFNAGTHIQTDVACNTAGGCFILTVDQDKSVKAKRTPPGELRFYRKEVPATAGELQTALDRTLTSLGDRSVVELILTGAVTAQEYENRGEMLDQALARFIEGSYSDSGLSRLISKELIQAEFPETSFAAGFLEELLAEPKEAQLAYELLQSLKGGA